MSTKFELKGLDDVMKVLKDLENLPQKCVNKSAKAGAEIAKNSAIDKAPFKSGTLRKGITIKAERTKLKGKKVYQVTLKNNPLFVKESLDGKQAFYPSSMEYGFITKGGKKIPGKHFLRDSLENNKTTIENIMVEVLSSEIDKLK